MKLKVTEIEEMGFEWPRYRVLQEQAVRVDQTIDLVETMAALETSRDFYKRWGGKVANRLWVQDRHIFRLVTHGRCTLMAMSFRALVTAVIGYHYDDPLILLNDPAEDAFAAKYAEATVEVMRGRRKDDWMEGLV